MNPMNEAWALLKGVQEMQFEQPQPTKDPMTGQQRPAPELPPSIPPVLQHGRQVDSNIKTVGKTRTGRGLYPVYGNVEELNQEATQKHPRSRTGIHLRKPAYDSMAQGNDEGEDEEGRHKSYLGAKKYRHNPDDIRDIGQEVSAVARPSVGNERSFQTLGRTGHEESAISRPPKQGFMARRRDAKQQRLAQRAEETGAGADYRQAFPMNATDSSVFEPSASMMRRVQNM